MTDSLLGLIGNPQGYYLSGGALNAAQTGQWQNAANAAAQQSYGALLNAAYSPLLGMNAAHHISHSANTAPVRFRKSRYYDGASKHFSR